MATYMVATIRITDPALYPDYVRLAGSSVANYGGRFLVRGGAMEELEGRMTADRVVVIEFDNREQALRWWNSPEYEAAKPVRRRASAGEFVLVEGYSA